MLKHDYLVLKVIIELCRDEGFTKDHKRVIQYLNTNLLNLISTHYIVSFFAYEIVLGHSGTTSSYIRSDTSNLEVMVYAVSCGIRP